MLFLLIGVMLFTYYQHVPLPRALARNDEILPVFIVTALPHGAAGFIVAAIVAAALSPSLNAMAATTVNDFYLKYCAARRRRADADARVARCATVVWGVVQIGVAIARAVDAAIGARRRPCGAVLRVRVGARRVPARHAGAVDHGGAAFAGMLAGLVAMTVVWGWTTVAFTWYVFIGAATTVGVAWLVQMTSSRRQA